MALNLETVLLTGSSGYLGSLIAEQLVLRGHEVFGLDILRPGEANIRLAGYHFFKADITQPETLPLEIRRVSVLIHCAALVHRKSGDLSRGNYFKVNCEGTRNLLLALDPTRLRRVIFLSTVSVYGDMKPGRMPDERTPPEPLDFYGESKVAAEREIREFSETHSVPYTIFRLAPVYGKSFLLNLSKRVYLPKKLAFYRIASGRQRISLCSIHNVVDTVTDCVNDQKYFNEILILKDPEDYSTLEIICVWKEIFSEARKPVLRIPLGIPEIGFLILGLVMPARAKSYKYQFKKIARDAVYSGAKMASMGIPLKWDLRNTLRVPEECSG